MSVPQKADNNETSEEPDYGEGKDQLEEEQEEKAGEIKQETTNKVF